MGLWHLALYTVAVVLALRSLVSLMVSHRRVYHERLVAEEVARRKAEKARARAERAKLKKAEEAGKAAA